MKQKLEELFWMEEGELHLSELIEPAAYVIFCIACVLAPIYLGGGL